MIVGQKVVCVDGKFPPGALAFYTALPVEGVVYVIRAVSLGVDWMAQPGEVCVHLIGLNNPRSEKAPFPERGFNAIRFRPLEEIKEKNRQTEPDVNEIVAPGVPA